MFISYDFMFGGNSPSLGDYIYNWSKRPKDLWWMSVCEFLQITVGLVIIIGLATLGPLGLLTASCMRPTWNQYARENFLEIAR